MMARIIAGIAAAAIVLMLLVPAAYDRAKPDRPAVYQDEEVALVDVQSRCTLPGYMWIPKSWSSGMWPGRCVKFGGL